MTTPKHAVALDSVKLASALVAPIIGLPLILWPELGLAVVAIVVATFLAWVSPAIPLGLSGMAAWFVPIVGITPPPNAIVVGLAAWIALGVCFAAVRDRGALGFTSLAWAPTVLASGLFAAMLIWAQASGDQVYGQEKIGLFVLGSLVFVVAGTYVGRHERDVEVLLWLIAGVATLASTVLLFQLAAGLEQFAPGRFSLAGAGNPIELGQQATVGIVIAGYFALARDGYARAVALGALPLLGIALLASGSRGPLIGLLVGAFVLAALLNREGVVRLNLMAIGGATTAFIVLATLFAPAQSADRLLGIVTGQAEGQDVAGRMELWSAAYDNITRVPLTGLGTGGFAVVAPGDQQYPHNFFLEAAVEFGLTGLVLTLLTVGFGVWLVLTLYRRADLTPLGLSGLVAAVFATAATHAMFSGDLAANPRMWLALGLLASLVTVGAARGRERLGIPAQAP